jgi:hypothetical protein
MTAAEEKPRSTRRRIAIIGAGPIGVECALYATRLGHAVDLYEAGEAGQHLCDWGHVRMFSPWEMNVSPLGLEVLSARGESVDFPPGACPTGLEYRQRYLLPLVRSPLLEGRVHKRTRVVSVGRTRLLKNELIGSPERAAYPFRLLIDAGEERERVVEADIVIDASGVYSHHNWMGSGGLPAVGERALGARIEYGIPDLRGAQAGHFGGRRTLVVGSGHSAATTVLALRELADHRPGTRVLWLMRGAAEDPYAPLPGDPLPERAELMTRAALLLRRGDPVLECRRGWVVEEVRDAHPGAFELVLSKGAERRRERVERIIANVGHRPDRTLYEELQVHECYATQGPMKLAAALLGGASADCLAQKSHGVDALRSPEPDFYILGVKSYGRTPNFLIRIGLAQVRELFQGIENDAALDLYATAA